jgi:hypothetical protein
MSEHKNKGGRPAGSLNKTTLEARQAIASFVDGNAHRLTEWLDAVAEGVKVIEQDADGNTIEKYVVPPNPAKAFDMFQSVVEYHVPKLARMEVAGDQKNPLQLDVHHTVFGSLLENLRNQKLTSGRD